MNIVQVNLQPDYGGAERHVLSLANGLKSQGDDVLIACHTQGELRNQADRLGIKSAGITAKGQFDIHAIIGLYSVFQNFTPDIVHLHTPRDYVSGLVAAKTARAPVVVLTRHMLLPVKRRMRWVYNMANGVVCLNSAVRNNLSNYGIKQEKLHLIHGAIELNDVSPSVSSATRLRLRGELGIDPFDVCIGIVGRIVNGKGHEILLKALDQLISSHGVRLLIVGDGPEGNALQALAKQSKMAERIVFTGFRDDISAVMAAIDILALPSTVSELLPLAPMEAMAASCPVVASDVGGVAEIVTHGGTGLLVPPGDSTLLAAALKQLIEDAPLRKRLGEAGFERVHQRFAMARMVADTQMLYGRLTKST